MLVKKLSRTLILVNPTNTILLSANKRQKKLSIYFCHLLINSNSNNIFLLNKTCFSLLKKRGHIPYKKMIKGNVINLNNTKCVKLTNKNKNVYIHFSLLNKLCQINIVYMLVKKLIPVLLLVN